MQTSFFPGDLETAQNSSRGVMYAFSLQYLVVGDYLPLCKLLWLHAELQGWYAKNEDKTQKEKACWEFEPQLHRPKSGISWPSFFLRLRNPGFRNQKPRGFHKSPPPLPRCPKKPFKIPKDPPLLVWECIGVHSAMERSAGRGGGSGMGGCRGGSGCQFMKMRGFPTRGFLTRGFAISDSCFSSEKQVMCRKLFGGLEMRNVSLCLNLVIGNPGLQLKPSHFLPFLLLLGNVLQPDLWLPRGPLNVLDWESADLELHALPPCW